jgi:hypothetical protein
MESEQWLIDKLIYAVTACFGAFGLAAFWTPNHLQTHSKLAQGCIIGGIAVGSSIALGGFLLLKLGLNPEQTDNVTAVGFLVGVSSVAILNFLGNFFDKREEKDIIEIVKEVKDLAK